MLLKPEHHERHDLEFLLLLKSFEAFSVLFFVAFRLIRYKQKESVNEKILRINGCLAASFALSCEHFILQPRRETVKEEGMDYSSREYSTLSVTQSTMLCPLSSRNFPGLFSSPQPWQYHWTVMNE